MDDNLEKIFLVAEPEVGCYTGRTRLKPQPHYSGIRIIAFGGADILAGNSQVHFIVVDPPAHPVQQCIGAVPLYMGFKYYFFSNSLKILVSGARFDPTP
jgi:hypothetical protein